MNNKYIKQFEELAHAYYEPGDKDYWEAIEFGKSFLLQMDKDIRKETLEEVGKKLDIHFLNNQSALLSVGAVKEFLAKLKE